MKTASYRLFLGALFCALMFELGGYPGDPMAGLGNDYLADLTNWTGIHIIVNVFEICIALTALLWLMTRKRARGAGMQRTLTVPMITLVAALAFGVVYGLANGGDLTYALWEVRGFAMLIAVYLLACVLITSEDRVNDVIWVVLISSMILAVDNTLRWLFVLRSLPADDLAYDHVDSVVIVCAVLLCLSLLAFGGTRAQRRYAIVALPVYVFAMEVMARRAAFAILPVGVLVLCLFFLRLRPHTFWRVVPPLAILCALYLVIFWNQSGVLAQPARAIRSQFSPDPRDAASNTYRDIERYDITLNIQRGPLTGLGFGQPYIMYIPLPNLSTIWPFWHYMTHNMILWVWMKDGAVGFAAFYWLLGRGAYDGSRAVATQREEWSLAAELHALLARRAEDGRAIDRVMHALRRNHYSPLRAIGQGARGKRRGSRRNRAQAFALNVPSWERSEHRGSVRVRSGGALAFLVTAVCMMPVQVAYSYVDLGLTNERDTALLGLAIAVIGQAGAILGISWTREKRSKLRTAAGDSSLEDTRDRVRALVKPGSTASSFPQTVPSTIETSKRITHAGHINARVGSRGELATHSKTQASLLTPNEALLPWETD